MEGGCDQCNSFYQVMKGGMSVSVAGSKSSSWVWQTKGSNEHYPYHRIIGFVSGRRAFASFPRWSNLDLYLHFTNAVLQLLRLILVLEPYHPHRDRKKQLQLWRAAIWFVGTSDGFGTFFRLHTLSYVLICHFNTAIQPTKNDISLFNIMLLDFLDGVSTGFKQRSFRKQCSSVR